jgi:hypothetical protein
LAPCAFSRCCAAALLRCCASEQQQPQGWPRARRLCSAPLLPCLAPPPPYTQPSGRLPLRPYPLTPAPQVRAAIFDSILSQAGTVSRLPPGARWLDVYAGAHACIAGPMQPGGKVAAGPCGA